MNFIKLHFYHPKMGCSGFDVCRGLTVLQPCFQGFLFSQNTKVWWTQLGNVSGTDGQDDTLRRRLALALARALHDGSLSSHLDKATVLKKTTRLCNGIPPPQKKKTLEEKNGILVDVSGTWKGFTVASLFEAVAQWILSILIGRVEGTSWILRHWDHAKHWAALNVEISLVGQRRATQSNASPSTGVSYYSWVRGLEFTETLCISRLTNESKAGWCRLLSSPAEFTFDSGHFDSIGKTHLGSITSTIFKP